MELLVTEITDMGGSRRCVAGWDLAGHRMVRPLPDGENWEAATIEQRGLSVGGILTVAPTGHKHLGDFPHSTEDTEVDANSIEVAVPGGVNWFGHGAPPMSASLSDAFGGAISHNSTWNGRRQGVFVPRGTKCASLSGIAIDVDGIEFVEDFNKLKVYLDDGDDVYTLSVSGHALRSVYDEGGPAAVKGSLPGNGTVHVRVGLARAFEDHPDKCYAMLNGINW
jgi:hypothetical protein